MATKKKVTKQSVRAGLAPAHRTAARDNRATARVATTRRPDRGDDMGVGDARCIAAALENVKIDLENYANHLRALDRKRLNGVGVRNQGFIDRALTLAIDNQEFLPHWLPIDKFQDDFELFTQVRAAFDISRQVNELLWNIVMDTADMAYTDALEFYASVREAAKRRVDAAESLNSELREFFRRRNRQSEDQPTEMEIKRDMNALLHGRKDGKVVVENFNPKTSGGERKLIDKTYRTKADFKETAEGEIST